MMQKEYSIRTWSLKVGVHAFQSANHILSIESMHQALADVC